MPIYEYECAGCGHELEAIQKFSDPPLKKCPECGKRRLRKQISAAAFHLKGTGWYATDFKDKGKAKEANGKDGDGKDGAKADGDGKESTAKESKSDDKKSDSKSDTKADAKTGGKSSKKADSSSGASAA